jgi:nickel-dependent lactate racemase
VISPQAWGKMRGKNMKLTLPYGRTGRECPIPDERVQSILESDLDSFRPGKSPETIVKEALEHPIGTPSLSRLSEGCRKIVIIASDHTRPVPSKLLMPMLLKEIRRGNPDADITILIATGCHRGTTRDELADKFGSEIVPCERIVIHDCDSDNNICIGTLPSGGQCYINRLAVEADLLVSEGFIEPHFFAGFSGGRKSVMPGVAARETVLYNHCADFIAHPKARVGTLNGNPIHEDMLWAAKKARLAFILNVVLNSKKEIVYAVAGDVEIAHQAGCDFLMQHCGVMAPLADIVIATNGGYPLDQNIYQAAKGICTAEGVVKPGGVIIMLAKSNDGHGGEQYYRQFRDNPDLSKLLAAFMKRDPSKTEPDQWQTQIQIRALNKASVIFVSDADDVTIRDMHMIPAKTVEEALAMADRVLGYSEGNVNVLPDAVSVIFRCSS